MVVLEQGWESREIQGKCLCQVLNGTWVCIHVPDRKRPWEALFRLPQLQGRRETAYQVSEGSRLRSETREWGKSLTTSHRGSWLVWETSFTDLNCSLSLFNDLHFPELLQLFDQSHIVVSFFLLSMQAFKIFLLNVADLIPLCSYMCGFSYCLYYYLQLLSVSSLT